VSSHGKSICSRYPKEIMRRLAVGDKQFKHNPYSYGGNTGWSPTGIHADLVEHRVRGYSVSESGLDKKSKAGSVEEMRKLWLDLLTASHKSHVESKKYSMRNDKSLNDKLGDVYGAVVVYLGESVPVHYMEALRGTHAHEGGDTGRTELIFVEPIKPKRNPTPEDAIADSVISMMQLYVRKFEDMNCAQGDNPSNPDKFINISTVAVDEAWWAYDDAKTDEWNQLEGVRQAVGGRFMERVNTTMFVQALADAASGKDLETPAVTMEHFRFAVAYNEELDRSLFAQLESGVLSSPLERCKQRVAARMDNFGDLKYDKEFADSVKDRIVGKQWVTKCLGKCSEWAQLQEQSGSLQRAQGELYNALETDGVLIPLPLKGATKKWRYNK
jgi:hypothetical protein